MSELSNTNNPVFTPLLKQWTKLLKNCDVSLGGSEMLLIEKFGHVFQDDEYKTIIKDMLKNSGKYIPSNTNNFIEHIERKYLDMDEQTELWEKGISDEDFLKRSDIREEDKRFWLSQKPSFRKSFSHNLHELQPRDEFNRFKRVSS